MSKFKYILIDEDGGVTGTDNEELALLLSETVVIVNTELGTTIFEDTEEEEVKETKWTVEELQASQVDEAEESDEE
jgi:hypothetical protein